jgi:hypothetical protein
VPSKTVESNEVGEQGMAPAHGLWAFGHWGLIILLWLAAASMTPEHSMEEGQRVLTAILLGGDRGVQ